MAEALWMRHEDRGGLVLLEVYWDDVSQKLTRILYNNQTSEKALLTIYHPTFQTPLRFELDANVQGKTFSPNPNQAPSLVGVDASFRFPASAFPASPARAK